MRYTSNLTYVFKASYQIKHNRSFVSLITSEESARSTASNILIFKV
jgi:hypothetical protein